MRKKIIFFEISDIYASVYVHKYLNLQCCFFFFKAVTVPVKNMLCGSCRQTSLQSHFYKMYLNVGPMQQVFLLTLCPDFNFKTYMHLRNAEKAQAVNEISSDE